MPEMRVWVSSAQYSFWTSNKFLFLVAWSRVYIFEETHKSIQDVIGDVFCPGKYCSNREKWEYFDGYVTTPRSIYGCEKCGAWSFVRKVAFMLQEHVKTTKTDKTRFFFVKKNLVPNKQLLPNFPFQSVKYIKKELCVDNKVQKAIGDVYYPSCRKEKCVYISTNTTTSFYDCRKCKACWHFLNIPFQVQNPTNMLFGGDCTNCFARKTNRDYEKGKSSPYLKKFLCQSDPSRSQYESIKAEAIPFMV